MLVVGAVKRLAPVVSADAAGPKSTLHMAAHVYRALAPLRVRAQHAVIALAMLPSQLQVALLTFPMQHSRTVVSFVGRIFLCG
jgi:hypothetical protein